MMMDDADDDTEDEVEDEEAEDDVSFHHHLADLHTSISMLFMLPDHLHHLGFLREQRSCCSQDHLTLRHGLLGQQALPITTG